MIMPKSNRIRHFVGVESSEQLAFIDELHALGLSNSIELPELIVVGDQNTGKSSVLQAITEISFPVQDGTCTRFPIQISFRQTPRDANGSGENGVRVKATITPGTMSSNDEAFLERIRGFRVESRSEALTQEVLGDMIGKATECMFGKEQARGETLCDATLRIERSGPDEMHWSIVDLPGLILNDGKPSQQELVNGTPPRGSMRRSQGTGTGTGKAAIAESIVREYMKNPRNIILLILADGDVELSKSIKVAQSIEGIETRAIGVLNKCDKREEGAGSWMVSLLQNNLATVPTLTHGWFGLCNRKPHEQHLTDLERDAAEEREFSEPAWKDVPKERFGIKMLMDYIDRERRAQLQNGMPSIISELKQKLRETEASLKVMGEPRISPRAQRYFVLQFCNEMQRMAEACIRGDYHDVPSSDDPKVRLRYLVQQRLDVFSTAVTDTNVFQLGRYRWDQELSFLRDLGTNPDEWREKFAIGQESGTGIYSMIYEEAMISRGTSLPGSVHPVVEEKVFRKMSAHWEQFAGEMAEDAKARVKECYEVLLRLAIPNLGVRKQVKLFIGRNMDEWTRDVDGALHELIEDNRGRPLFTKNPYFEKEMTRLEKERNDFFSKPREPSAPAEGNVQSGGHGSKEGEQHYLPTLLNNIMYTRSKVHVYYDIAVYRFIDNVATQVIERHVLGPKCPLRSVSAENFTQLDDVELAKIAGEDPADISTRKRLEETKDGYRKALEKWEQLSVL